MTKLTEVQQIQQQIKDLQERHALLIMEGRDEAIQQIKTMMADYTIEAADLGLVLKPPKRIRDPQPAKYRDHNTGRTWTGQGKPPKWIEGKEYNEFLIATDSNT